MDRISLDYNEAMAASAGAAGLRDEELSAQWLRAREAVAALRERREEDAAYLDLPRDAGALAEAKAAAADLSARFDDLVVLGIGGSSLGAKAIASALLPPFSALRPREARAGRGMRLFFPDNSDPDTFAALLDTVDLARTAFAVVTKSGGTAETMAQFLIVRERLRARFGDEGYRARIVAVTDPAQGALRRIAGEEGLRTLAIPPPVGGRFSALTAVGLLPAAAAGIDVDALCAGAAAMAERALEPEPSRNPAAVLAALFVAMDRARGRTGHVLMPYADALRDMGDWFVQLWGESLGKSADVGPTPLRAVGATDQHSLLQFLMEGPDDKFVLFIAVGTPRADVEIPAAFPAIGDVAYLGGHRMGELFDAERRATAAALARAGRTSATLHLPALTPFAMGETLMLFEAAVSIAGALYGVNPYGQPGVELGKRYTGALLARAGSDDAARELSARPAPSARYVL